jgi:hypothetical protein
VTVSPAVICGPLAAEHPIEVCYGSELHCLWHEVDEPREGFRYCLECAHMFATASELLAEHNKHLAEFGIEPETDPDGVYCCPFCIHDW